MNTLSSKAHISQSPSSTHKSTESFKPASEKQPQEVDSFVSSQGRGGETGRSAMLGLVPTALAVGALAVGATNPGIGVGMASAETIAVGAASLGPGGAVVGMAGLTVVGVALGVCLASTYIKKSLEL